MLNRYCQLDAFVAGEVSNMTNTGVVLFVNDVMRVAVFYRDLIQMNVAIEAPSHTELTLPGFDLVIHKIPMDLPVECDATGRAITREDSYIKICLPVVNIADARMVAQSLGGYIKGPEFEWQYRGYRVCDGQDPEGNVFQVRETLE
jgi:hypothetical protein